jgi:hypothetical protein
LGESPVVHKLLRVENTLGGESDRRILGCVVGQVNAGGGYAGVVYVGWLWCGYGWWGAKMSLVFELGEARPVGGPVAWLRFLGASSPDTLRMTVFWARSDSDALKRAPHARSARWSDPGPPSAGHSSLVSCRAWRALIPWLGRLFLITS